MGWTKTDLKLPQDGSWVALIEVSESGDTELLAYADRKTLTAAIPLLQDVVDRVEEEGHPDADLFERQRDLLHVLKEVDA